MMKFININEVGHCCRLIKSSILVNLDSFLKSISFQKISIKGIQNIGKTIEILAEAEGLDAHKNAVTLRLNSLKKQV